MTTDAPQFTTNAAPILRCPDGLVVEPGGYLTILNGRVRTWTAAEFAALPVSRMTTEYEPTEADVVDMPAGL